MMAHNDECSSVTDKHTEIAADCLAILRLTDMQICLWRAITASQFGLLQPKNTTESESQAVFVFFCIS